MQKETKDKISKLWNKTKATLVDVSLTVADATKKAYVKTSDAIKTSIENNKLEKEIKHKKELSDYQELVNTVKESIELSFVRSFINDLGESPSELFCKSVKSFKQSFPIPAEQTIIWAYTLKETNRVGGIVVTDKGVFVKTIVNVFEEKALKKENRKVSELFYYPWTTFNPNDFLPDGTLNAFFSLNSKDLNGFVNACKTYQDYKNVALAKAANYYAHAEEVIGGDSVSISGSLLKGNLKFTRDNGFGNNPQAGFGLFAEQANNMADLAHFKNAKVVGGDNAKNGPDRLVNGVRIQTKYYNTGRRSVGATFDNKGTGNYRYYNPDGTPMKLEVPKGQYDSAVKTFRNKIIEGKVPGVTNPDEAENIIVEGHYTYEQAIRISKAGTIESLTYDIKTGAVATTCVFGISFLINSYLCYRKTHNLREATIDGLIAGGKSGALAMTTHVLVSQLSRTQFFSDIMTKSIIKSGAVSAVGGFIVFSIPETYNYATKKISGAQYATNLAVLSASIVGGTAGAYAGGAIGTAAGTAAGMGAGSVPLAIAGASGGVAGGLVAGTAAGIGTSQIIDIFFEGDDKRIARLFNAITLVLFNEYLLDEHEIDEFIVLMNSVTPRKFNNLFKTIHASNEQVKTIRDFLEPYFESIVSKRELFSPELDLSF